MDRDKLTAIAAQRGHPSADGRAPMSVADIRAAVKARSKGRSASVQAMEPSAIRKVAKALREARRG